ncbi:MAG: ATP-grasp domain-containing protein [Chitinophagaceae bacterium]
MLAPILIFDIPSSGSGGPLMDWLIVQKIPYFLLVRNKEQTNRLLSEEAKRDVVMHECNPFTHESIVLLLEQQGITHLQGVLCALDGLMPTAARIAQQFNCPFALPEIIAVWSDKGLARQFCQQHHIAVPNYAWITSTHHDDIAHWSNFPAIIKPRRGAGGLGVQRVDCTEDILRFFAERQQTFDANFWMIEQLLSGPIFSVEGLVHLNEMHVFGISDRTWGAQPYFVEEGVNFPVLHGTQLEKELIAFTDHLIRESQFHHGFFHIEIMATPEGLFLIEFNLRYGGPLPMQIEAAYGVDFYAGLYALCCGNKPQWNDVKFGSSVFYLYPSKVGVLKKIDTRIFEQYPEVYLYRMNPNRTIGDTIRPVTSFKDYLCLVYVKAENAEISHAVVRALRSEFAEAVCIEPLPKIGHKQSLTLFGRVKRKIKRTLKL